jgi:energy-coupling factor transporter ATP-binding protein EcfA2
LTGLLESRFDPPKVIAVVGPSGSGKSSLVWAGLLPRLARSPDSWLIATGTLDAIVGLRDRPSDLRAALVVVDQAEDLARAAPGVLRKALAEAPHLRTIPCRKRSGRATVTLPGRPGRSPSRSSTARQPGAASGWPTASNTASWRIPVATVRGSQPWPR